MSGPGGAATSLFSGRRLAVVAAILALGNLAGTAAILRAIHAPAREGSASVMDFAAFWTAARMALEGEAALAYDPALHRAAMNAALGIDYDRWMSWFYPPQFLLMIAPLGSLPLAAAQAAFTGATLGLYLWTAWRILPRLATLAAVLVPAPVVLTLANGQTGFLVPALLGLAGLAVLRGGRGEILAGLPLGLLGIKPQVVLAVPVALAAGLRLSVLAAGAAVFLALALASVAAFGFEPWRGFVAGLAGAGRDVADLGDKWLVNASLYGWLRGQGVPFTPAMAAQAALALPVLAILALAWRSPAVPRALAIALMAYASAAITPRIMDYDLLILVTGALFQVRHMTGAGATRWEPPLLAVAALVPLADFLTPLEVNAFLAPVLFAACALRIRQDRREGTAALTPAG